MKDIVEKLRNSKSVDWLLRQDAAEEILRLRDQVKRYQKKIKDDAGEKFEEEDLKFFQEIKEDNDYVLEDIEHLARELHKKIESTISYYSDPWGKDIGRMAQWIEILARLAARRMKRSS